MFKKKMCRVLFRTYPFLSFSDPIPYIPIPELFGNNEVCRVFGTTIGIFITLAKSFLFMFIPITTRWTLPRLRMDQLLNLGWKFLLPISLGNFFINIFVPTPFIIIERHSMRFLGYDSIAS